MEKRLLYHGSMKIVSEPEIRITKFHKDFYYGFYCTIMKQQAERWATRFGRDGYVNVYEYIENENLNLLRFDEMTEEWLDFIINCRLGKPHAYDIVEGPMANDTIFNYVQSFVDGRITRSAFWELAKFKRPTHQISFHTIAALQTIKFIGKEKVYGKE
jgi:hypothetical protein